MTFYNEQDPDFSIFTPEVLMADAQKKVELLRQLAAEFKAPDTRPLTRAEIALATRTPIVFLEKGAVFGEAAAPDVRVREANIQRMRVTLNADVAYGKVLAQAEELTRQIRLAMARRKLEAVLVARDIYRIAKGYAQTQEGDSLKGHVEAMGKTLTRPRRSEKSEGEGTRKEVTADNGGKPEGK